MFSRMGSAAFKKDLDNIKLLSEALGHPHQQFKSIHVGGTNGKGSVSHMLAAVLQKAGYTTGLYTSPHLYDFRERIKVNGEMVTEAFVVDFVERIQPLIETIQPSFFEITVAMAFEYFQVSKVDLAIVEVGLGGRLDSTNIITPLLSVITNIGWDHMNMLGNSLEEIAREKAGIIKQGIPVVIGERQQGLDNIFIKTAKEKNAAVYFGSDGYEAVSLHWEKNELELEVMQKTDGSLHTFTTDLQGIYQKKNIATVLQAIEVLKQQGIKISGDDTSQGLRHVKKLTGLYGRWDVVRVNPMIVLEVAHNKDGIKQMLLHLENISYKQLHLVIGMVKDKDVDEVLGLLPGDAQYYFTKAQIPRALDAELLQQKAEKFSLHGHSYPHVNAALHAAMQNAEPNDIIVVCGSIFLVAEVDRTLIPEMA